MTVVAVLRAPSSSESIAAIRAGLKSLDARARAASARIASVSDPSRFIDDLSSALAAETDAEAAREESWALAIGDPVGCLAPILKAAEREGIRDGVIEGLGAAKGARMLEIWPALPKSLLAEGAPALVRGARRTGNLARVGPLILRDQLDAGWRELLSPSIFNRVERGLLLAGLSSPSAQIRTDAYVALLPATGLRDTELELKPPAGREERIARRLFEAAFGRPTEIELDRELAQVTDEDGRLAAQIRALRPKDPEAMARLRAGLKPTELSALLGWIEGWNGGYAVQRETVEVTSERVNASKKAWGKSTTTIGAINGLPTGFADAVLREWGCRGEARPIVADLVFEEDGRPSQIRMPGKPGGKGCGAAAQILFTAALGSLPQGPAVLVLPTHRQWLGCFAATRSDQWEPKPLPALRSAQFAVDLEEPTKKTNAIPEYFGAHTDRQIWGDFALQAVLGRAGCMVSMEGFRVTEGIQDVDFIDTVSRWAYSPMVFRGAPTPVRVEVKVSFVLN